MLKQLKFSFPYRATLIATVFSVIFISGSNLAHADDRIWYVTPIASGCTTVAADYDISLLPPGWAGPYETCSNWETMTGCGYEICHPVTNDTYNPIGAVASLGASMNKSTYSPGEHASVILFGSLGSHDGSDIAWALLFYSLGEPILSSITCFFFSCPVTREVSGGATVPYLYTMPELSDLPASSLEPLDDYYGFYKTYNGCNPDMDSPGNCFSWLGFTDLFWQSRKGSFYATKNFKAPLTPGSYTIDLYGCHEKYYCVYPAPLNFTVTGGPSININFSYLEMIKKVKSWFE